MNELNKPYMLYMLIELIVFVIPIGALIWKAAKQSGKIDGMGEKLKKLEARVEKNETQSAKDISEIKASMEKINVNNTQILTSLEFIQDSIKEIKSKTGK